MKEEQKRKLSDVRKKLFAEGKLVHHNKGKTKFNYKPLAEVGRKVSGKLNGQYGKVPWNKGLTKHDNPDKITYGVSGDQHWNWNGGSDRHDLRKEEWYNIRLAALKRDNCTCQLCGKKGNDVHHKVPYRVSHDNSLDNLVTLCKKCHSFADNIYVSRSLKFEDIVRTVQKCTETPGNAAPGSNKSQ